MNYEKVSALIIEHGMKNPLIDREFMEEPFFLGPMTPGMLILQKKHDDKVFRDLLEAL